MLEQILAAQTSALDPAKLRGVLSGTLPAPALDDGVIPYVVAWPVEQGVVDVAERRVPDVVGLSFRRAAARLHQVGLRVLIDGRGPVAAVEPAAGTKVVLGTLITLTGDGGNDHP